MALHLPLILDVLILLLLLVLMLYHRKTLSRRLRFPFLLLTVFLVLLLELTHLAGDLSLHFLLRSIIMLALAVSLFALIATTRDRAENGGRSA